MQLVHPSRARLSQSHQPLTDDSHRGSPSAAAGVTGSCEGPLVQLLELGKDMGKALQVTNGS